MNINDEQEELAEGLVPRRGGNCWRKGCRSEVPPLDQVPVFGPGEDAVRLTLEQEDALWATAARERDRHPADPKIVRRGQRLVRTLLTEGERTSGQWAWAHIEARTCIPVALLKRWWWGIEPISVERESCLRAHSERLAATETGAKTAIVLEVTNRPAK